jgi:hypothetical protein
VLAGGEVEGPAVKGANDAAALDVALGERASGMGAFVVDNEDLVINDKDSQGKAVDLNEFALAFA